MGQQSKREWAGREDGKVYCVASRRNTCHKGRLLTAETSEAHDRALGEATEHVNHILTTVEESAPPGRNLALIDTSLGPLLVWVERSDEPADSYRFVTADSPDHEIAHTLRLDGH